MSTGKIIENILIQYFEKKKNDLSCLDTERALSNALLESIEKYVHEKLLKSKKT
jgi:hypothetical protein